jgi:hypothetical protein
VNTALKQGNLAKASIKFRFIGQMFCRDHRKRRGAEPRAESAAEEDFMRNIGLALGAIMVVVVLGSFAPITWSTAPASLSAAGSISPTDLTRAAGTLPVSEQADAF